ncbi:hypothetical protein [Oceanobacter sp. 4_MG-2023]|uniref:hypothetical protein n=1 Tax=Oceanobacter sp. 4_MG-2023 TaxID=3062623 RepID=UPI0027345321|nr:hypothetical protein [Oceanobacter sp. 4_MG-2023]MDP2546913.1 hypothetical protein [Oceanobacter sp. 4_MG-2023]
MKRSHHEILKHIFDNDDVGIKELSSIMVRKHNDHRDFYALAALIDAGYIGFTGPIFNKEDGALDTYQQVRLFQAYSQGDENQTYEEIMILGENEDSYLYVAAKAIEYFHTRDELRKGWILTAVLAFISAVISGVIISRLTVTAIEVIAK